MHKKQRNYSMSYGEYKKYRACGRKKDYSRESTARRVAFRRGKIAYKCEYCGNWHIGGTAPQISQEILESILGVSSMEEWVETL